MFGIRTSFYKKVSISISPFSYEYMIIIRARLFLSIQKVPINNFLEMQNFRWSETDGNYEIIIIFNDQPIIKFISKSY